MLINHNLSEHQTQHQILERRALLHVSSPSFYPPINQTNLDKIKCWFLGNQIYMHCLLLTLPKTAGFVYNLVRDDLIYSAVSIFVFHTKFQIFHHTNSAYNFYCIQWSPCRFDLVTCDLMSCLYFLLYSVH